MALILVRYNELGLKSPKVRRRFQKKLVRNMEAQFLGNGVECIIDSMWGRIFVHTNDTDSGISILKRIFGVSSISVVETGKGGITDISKTVLDYCSDLLQPGQSFAVRTRRLGTHDFTSMDLAKHLGAAILDHFKDLDLKVDLSRPEVIIYIEVRNENYYIFSEKIQAVGGLPLGTQGRILGIYENKNSLMAWWLMMKRGAVVIPVRPVESEDEMLIEPKDIIKDKDSLDMYRSLIKWSPKLKFRTWLLNDHEKNTGQIKDTTQLELYTSLVSQMSKKYKVDGLVSGLRLNEFENELKPAGLKDEEIFKYPIFLPLIGFSEEDLNDLETQIKA